MTLAGHYLGHYHIIRQIGQGGMGEVYLAEDSHIARQVAIKVVHNEQAPYPNNNTIQEASRLFQREMRAISQLDHSHILSIYDFGEELLTSGSVTYMVMPYRSEGSLVDWLAQRSSTNLLSAQDVGNLLTQASSALQHAHDHNIIHQDVKPSNFLLRSNSEHPTYPDLFLVDFGVAKIMTTISTASNSVRGTAAYMAPEQWSGDAVPASDQYALAVMAYQLLTGTVPFQGRLEQVMFQHLHGAPRAPSALNPHLSQVLDTVLLQALAKQPKERFSSVSTFCAAFQQALVGTLTMPTLEIEEIASIAPTLAAPLSQSAPLLWHEKPISSPGKSGLRFSLSIIGALVLVGIIIVSIFFFHQLPSKHTAIPGTHASVAPLATVPLLPKNTPIPILTDTTVPTTIPYPSYDNAEAAIKYYYVNGSDFKGKNIIQSFDSITYHQQVGPRDQPQFIACAEYKFALVSSPDITADTARHTFTFQYSNTAWSVIDIGNWDSC